MSVSGGVQTLTVRLLVDSEGAENVIHPFASAEATPPQHHIEGLCEKSFIVNMTAITQPTSRGRPR